MEELKTLVISLCDDINNGLITEEAAMNTLYNAVEERRVVTPTVLLSTLSTTSKKSWADLTQEDEDIPIRTNSFRTTSTETTCTNSSVNTNPRTVNKKSASVTPSDNSINRFKKNCEKTIMYFITNYKTEHIDSVKNINELNLVVLRLLGIDPTDEEPSAYSRYCWLLRNSKCYYGDKCVANKYNLCTFAHTGNQYCCIEEDGYKTWEECYYRCLKLHDENDDISQFVSNYGEKKLPLHEYKNIPESIIEWYDNMTDNLP